MNRGLGGMAEMARHDGPGRAAVRGGGVMKRWFLFWLALTFVCWAVVIGVLRMAPA